MNRTNHKFAEIWKQEGFFVKKGRDGKYQEVTNPSDSSYMLVGETYDTAQEAMDAAIEGHAKFVSQKVISI